MHTLVNDGNLQASLALLIELADMTIKRKRTFYNFHLYVLRTRISDALSCDRLQDGHFHNNSEWKPFFPVRMVLIADLTLI
jgi:hypothetical protein